MYFPLTFCSGAGANMWAGLDSALRFQPAGATGPTHPMYRFDALPRHDNGDLYGDRFLVLREMDAQVAWNLLCDDVRDSSGRASQQRAMDLFGPRRPA